MFWVLKEPSHRDGSFEHQQHLFWLRNKKKIHFHTLIWGPVKAVFTVQNYDPQLQIESVSMFIKKSALYCVAMIQYIKNGLNLSIISREIIHKHNFGQYFKLQSAVVRSLNSN